MSDQTPGAPHARGQRAAWESLPAPILDALQTALGDEIIATTTMPGGFSPGIAARVRTGNGQRAFVKAVSASQNAVAPTFHRREILVSSHLPPGDDLPVPRLLWSYDEGQPDTDREGWVALAYQDVAGEQPAQPWRPDELDRVIDALNRLAAHLTPTPFSADAVGTVTRWGPIRTNFWRLRAGDPPAALNSWARRNLDRLADLSDQAPAAVAGDTLLHLDLRADNVLLTPERVYIVDWPHARIGAAWLDPLFMAPSVTMHGGPEPEEFMARFDAVRGVDPAAITATVAQIAGFFTSAALEPEEPGLPGLRAFQEAQGAVARRWLAQRTGWT